MPTHQTKVLTVDAVQLSWDSVDDIVALDIVGNLTDGKCDICCLDDDWKPLPEVRQSKNIGAKVPTINGVVVARETDWIVKDSNGVLSVVKDSDFVNLYEEYVAPD